MFLINILRSSIIARYNKGVKKLRSFDYVQV